MITNSFVIYDYDYRIGTTTIPIDIELGKQVRNSHNPNLIVNQVIKDNSAVAIYTDGSKQKGKPHVGSACHLPETNKTIKKSINPHASVYTAECIGMKYAMDLALQVIDKNVFIFCDSLSVLQAISSTKISSTTNQIIFEIKKKYLEFTSTYPNKLIKFFWIPSHTGITENEHVDLLAKEATEIGTCNVLQIPHTDFYELYKQTLTIDSQTVIVNEGLTKGVKYFQTFYTDSKKPWYYNKSLNRETIVTVNRCRANHYSLNESLYRINVVNSPLCKCEQSHQNINHILFQCSLYNEYRVKLLRELAKINLRLPLNVDNIISQPNIPACIAMLNYLKQCKLKV